VFFCNYPVFTNLKAIDAKAEREKAKRPTAKPIGYIVQNASDSVAVISAKSPVTVIKSGLVAKNIMPIFYFGNHLADCPYPDQGESDRNKVFECLLIPLVWTNPDIMRKTFAVVVVRENQ
jgi:hypothetical protein